ETPEGEVIGKHMGLMYYTLGQRQGLGIGGLANHPEAPWYVADKNLERNVLIAVQGKHHPLLYTDSLATEAVDWIAGEPPAAAGHFTAKTRYRQADVPCHMHTLPDGGVEVRFDTPQRAVTPGQSLGLYDGEICLGGGVIHTTWNATELAARIPFPFIAPRPLPPHARHWHCPVSSRPPAWSMSWPAPDKSIHAPVKP